jgi:hypothetical protein
MVTAQGAARNTVWRRGAWSPGRTLLDRTSGPTRSGRDREPGPRARRQGSIRVPAGIIGARAPVAQWIERRPPEPKVAGSNPVGRATAHSMGNIDQARDMAAKAVAPSAVSTTARVRSSIEPSQRRHEMRVRAADRDCYPAVLAMPSRRALPRLRGRRSRERRGCRSTQVGESHSEPVSFGACVNLDGGRGI